MRVKVDEWKSRTIYVRLVHAQHASWLVLRKLKGCGLRLLLGRNTDGLANLHSSARHQAHSIQPLTPIDHLPPPFTAQVQARGLRCPYCPVSHRSNHATRYRRTS